MNERIKNVRKALNLTMEKFGDKIKISKSAVSRLEKGINNPSDQTIGLIVGEFNVNEEWLRTGRGEMFVETKDDYIASLSKRYSLDEFDIKIVESYLSLDNSSRKVIKNYICKLAENLAMTEEECREARVQAEIDAEVESYRQELILEAKGAVSASDEYSENSETKIKKTNKK